MARGVVEDPIKVFRFQAVIDGFIRTGFKKITGLKRETEVIKYREGGDNTTEQKSLGLTSFPLITFERGQIVGSTKGGDQDYITWANQCFQLGSAATAANPRKDIDVNQYNATNTLARTWRVYESLVKTYDATSDLDALTNENSYEKLGVEHEGWEKVF